MIGYEGAILYRHQDWVARAPASNEKLLLSMALLDRFPPTTTIPTRVLATSAVAGDGVLDGDLWIVGHGDPETGRQDIAALAADARRRTGVHRVRGRVMGATGPFARDWFAPGWKDYFPTYYIALPTALTYRRQPRTDAGATISDPERRAAAALTKQLRARGASRCTARPGMGTPPADLEGLATVQSDPLVLDHAPDEPVLQQLPRRGVRQVPGRAGRGAPGTIAGGRARSRRSPGPHGVSVVANDGSGLSYANRVSADGHRAICCGRPRPRRGARRCATRWPRAARARWRIACATCSIRAKTGTLTDISALSGWVWLEREGAWAEFSILSQGMSKTALDPDRERDRAGRERERRSPLTGPVAGAQSSARSRGCSRPNV